MLTSRCLEFAEKLLDAGENLANTACSNSTNGKYLNFFSMTVHISPSEQTFIADGIDLNIRGDGRSRTDYRQIILETALISQASGSARCLLANTDILVGIKVEVGAIDSQNSLDGEDAEDNSDFQTPGVDKGRVVCSVDCSPSASRFFSSRHLEDLCTEYGQYMNRLLNGSQGGINLESLVIIPGSTCWVIYIDALILNYEGNLLDAILLATRAALHNTRIAKCIVEEAEGKFDFDVADEETEVIQGWNDVPLCVTLCKVGSRFIVDATPLEDLSADTRVMVSVNSKGKICSVQKDGFGYLEPTLLAEMIQVAQKIGVKMIGQSDLILANEEGRIDAMKDSIGFMNS